MSDFLNKKMVCDTPQADGGVYFSQDELTFIPRDERKDKYRFSIKYDDIKEVKVKRGIKSIVIIYTNDDKKNYFYLHKVNTFLELIESARNQNNLDFNKNDAKPLSNDDLTKLEKLNQLHKDNVISDEQFEYEKNLILKK